MPEFVRNVLTLWAYRFVGGAIILTLVAITHGR